jgi:hypothetical protein
MTRVSTPTPSPNKVMSVGWWVGLHRHALHADRIGPEVTTRDSILLTYFVDAGALRFLRNRGKRIANFILSEVRNRLR